VAGKQDLAKIRAAPDAAAEVLANAKIHLQYPLTQYPLTLWSPAGNWIAYPALDGIDLISPDGKSGRNLTCADSRSMAS
jgi:hypothetical protein